MADPSTMTPSRNNEKALAVLKEALEPGKHMDFRRAIQEAIAALSQPTTGACEVWYVTDNPDQNGEYGVWLGRHTCAIGATDKSSAIRLCNLLNAKQQPTPFGGEVVTVPSRLEVMKAIEANRPFLIEMTDAVMALIQSRVGGR